MAATSSEYALTMDAGGVELEGDLTVPAAARGLVVFAPGSGSSRLSPRNQFVARELQQGNLATLLFDLLTSREEAEDAITAQLRFDIGLLGQRLIAVTDWLKQDSRSSPLAIGYFGASTGAAAALIAAAARPSTVRAVVSRGGRPDLAAQALARVAAPTLLIVGGNDPAVLDLNRRALKQMTCEKRLEVVPGATHLFPEAGALEEVARLARDWFMAYLGREATTPAPTRIGLGTGNTGR